MDHGSRLWNALRGMRNLRTVTLSNCTTSVLVNLPLVPQIKELSMVGPLWNLTTTSLRKRIAALKGVHITLGEEELRPQSHQQEIKCWKSLPFVTYEEDADDSYGLIGLFDQTDGGPF